ncbi:MAG: nuclear transport factor 2 family protein [Pyrinomonadaceae bacterium]
MAIAVLTASAQTADKDDAELRSLVKRMTEAQINFKPNILDEIFTPDYVEISPIGEFDERTEVLGFYKPEQKPGTAGSSTTVEADEFSIRKYGTFAIVITRLNFVITVDGKPVPPRSMRAMLVCRRLGGQWKIASVQYTGISTPATSRS